MKTQKSASCFTLIELLVVIAIIAILAAILLPALNQARQRGIQTDCMSRQKSVGSAINMYRGEYNDMFVSQNAKSGAGDSSKDANWISILMKCKYINSESKHEDAVSFVCPAQQAKEVHVERGYGVMSYHQYTGAWNKYMYAINLKMQCVQRMGESKILLVADSGTYNSATSAGATSVSLMNFSPTAAYGLPYARHNGMLNGLLLDGHVESVTGEEMNSKLAWIRILWSGTKTPTARTAKIPYYITPDLQPKLLSTADTIGESHAL